jgi:hypothetical protein
MDKGYIIMVQIKNMEQSNNKPKIKKLQLKEVKIEKKEEENSPIFTSRGIIDGDWIGIQDIFWR